MDAIEQLTEAIFHDPDNGSYYYYRGLAYSRSNNNNLAKFDFFTSLTLVDLLKTKSDIFPLTSLHLCLRIK